MPTVLNPGIDFEHSPFVVQQELAAWPRPRIEVDGDIKEYPRIAGISSFGAGGANAHLIIEEYIADRAEDDPPSWLPDRTGADTAGTSRPAMIVLSAKHEEQLKERARRLLAVLREDGRAWSDRDLADMAYTLQVGREAMEERLALMVHSSAELAEKLALFLEGRTDVPDLFRGRVAGASPASMPPDLSLVCLGRRPATRPWEPGSPRANTTSCLSLWVKGLAVDWDTLLRQRVADARPDGRPPPAYQPAHVSLCQRTLLDAYSPVRSASRPHLPAILHPLLHRNTSDLTEQRFSSTFSGREFFLADHVVRGQKILPAVAYLEMAREALQRAAGSLQEGRSEFPWKRWSGHGPLWWGTRRSRSTSASFPRNPRTRRTSSVRIAYEIYSLDEAAARVVHSQGRAHLGAATDTSHLDLAALQAQCDRGSIDADQCYEAFAAMGIDYGAGHRGIQRLYLGSGQVLAKLVLPDQLRDTDDRFVLHPSLMDAALQAALGLLGASVRRRTGKPR